MGNVVVELEQPWSGTLDWRALAGFRNVLARRVADAGQWVIGVAGPEDNSAAEPDGLGVFGHSGYDAKNDYEALTSRHASTDGFPLRNWWNARHVVVLRKDMAVLRSTASHIEEGREMLFRLLATPPLPAPLPTVEWIRDTEREEYLERLSVLMAHIRRGDIYEVNYCTRRSAVLPGFDPYAAFARLLAHTDAPFAGFLRNGHRFALCASPERFLRLEGDRVITQPIKGTRPRHAEPHKDKALAEELAADPKERSEHVMAVDVARNDLGRVAVQGSVHMQELCAVKSYATVHQLVSTVAARLKPGITPADLLRATFPMASMTGAPKIRAMQVIDAMEGMGRGLYSGTMGYFLPDGTADLNVVIRTLTYDARTGAAALITGGAITAASVPEAEWEECEVKARSVLNAFGYA